MNHLLFLEAVKPGEIMLIVIVLILPLWIAYRFGYYKGKDAARKEENNKN
jgi:hypothetical protein